MTRYERIWEASREVTGGYGFWGGVCCRWNIRELVRAWVDALTEKSYDDPTILIYGDTKDGRWMVDQTTNRTTYEEFKRIVRNQSKIDAVRAEDPAHWQNGLIAARRALDMVDYRRGAMRRR